MKKKVLNRIKAVLAEEGKTNKELGEMLGVAEPTVSRWCTNTTAAFTGDVVRDCESVKKKCKRFFDSLVI